MSTVAALADRLRSGSPAFTAWCGMPEPAIAGLLAREAFDAVTLDMQHGAIDLAATIRAHPRSSPRPESRPSSASRSAISRPPRGLLDAGASAVIAPMINTRRGCAAVRRLHEISAARRAELGAATPPSPSRACTPGDYFAQANGFSLSFAMVETREALAYHRRHPGRAGHRRHLHRPVRSLHRALERRVGRSGERGGRRGRSDHALQRATAPPAVSPLSLRSRESGPPRGRQEGL